MAKLYTIKHDIRYTKTSDTYKCNLCIVNKDTLLHIAKIYGIKLPKSHTKEKMAEALSAYVLSNPEKCLEKLSVKELNVLKDFVEVGANTHVVRPSRKYYKTMRDLLLVSVCHNKKERKLYFLLPDELRELFAPLLGKAIKEAKKREKKSTPKAPIIPIEEPEYIDDEDDDWDLGGPIDMDDELLKHLKTVFPMIDFDEIYGLKEDIDDDDTDDDEDELEEESGQFSYSCSIPMMDDIRALRYDAQAEVCKAFHKLIKKGFPDDDSYLITRFEETYDDIIFSHLDDSLDQIHYAINDLDNAIYEIDMFDPMTFFDVERKLAPIIRRSPKKGENK